MVLPSNTSENPCDILHNFKPEPPVMFKTPVHPTPLANNYMLRSCMLSAIFTSFALSTRSRSSAYTVHAATSFPARCAQLTKLRRVPTGHMITALHRSFQHNLHLDLTFAGRASTLCAGGLKSVSRQWS